MKPANQFRNIHLFGQEERQINRISSPKEFSTETNSFTSVVNKKPDLGGSGFDANDGRVNISIIANPELNASSAPACSETSMNYDSGYFRVPRSLTEHPMFKDAKLEYQHLYMVILSRAAYVPYEINDNGKLIRVEIGEICFSIDQIKKFCSKHISTKQVERGIQYFRKCHFLGQRPGHRRSILKITHSECYEMISDKTGTRIGKRPGQDRDINKEDKEIKEEKKKDTKKKSAAASVGGVVAEKAEKIKIRDTIHLTQEEIDKAKAKHGNPLFEAMCDILDAYKTSSGKAYKDDYGCFKAGSWVIARAKESLEAPQAAAPVNAKPKTLGDVLANASLGSYTYTAKFGVFELLSSQGYTMFQKSMSDLEGIEAELKARRLWKT